MSSTAEHPPAADAPPTETPTSSENMPSRGKNADQRTWFPIEFRSHPTRLDADTLITLYRITELARENNVPLPSLWAAGGALARSVSGAPLKLTRNDARHALERLRDDILAGNPTALPSHQAASDVELAEGFCDFGSVKSDDEELPETDTNENTKTETDALAHKVLAQLKYNVRLTDDVLQFLISNIHHGSESQLMDALWFSVTNPPRLPNSLRDPVTMFFPLHIDDHWILVHVNPQDCTNVTVYDSLPTPERTASVTQALKEWFAEHLPSWRANVSFQDCARQSDSTGCGIFVITFLERLLRGHSTSLAIESTTEREQLLRAISSCDTSRFPNLGGNAIIIQQIQDLIRADPTTAQFVNATTSGHVTNSLSIRPFDRSSSASITGTPIEAAVPGPESPISGTPITTTAVLETVALKTTIPDASTEAKTKRKRSDESDSPKKRQNVDIDDIASLSALLQDAIAKKERDKKLAKVNEATTRLNSANVDLSQAESTLKAANVALQQGQETSAHSVINYSAFATWIASAPTATDELFTTAVQGAQNSMGAYLAKYEHDVEKSLSQLQPNVAAAEGELEHRKSVVDDRKQDLNAVEKDDESTQQLNELGSVLERFIQ
ncbi:hypothetical protein ACHAPU_010812 [Fusarium lateritium]